MATEITIRCADGRLEIGRDLQAIAAEIVDAQGGPDAVMASTTVQDFLCALNQSLPA